jgi:predicted nucleic acid-binding protein
MRVLLDTNILIYREDNHILPSDLQELHKILNDLNAVKRRRRTRAAELRGIRGAAA